MIVQRDRFVLTYCYGKFWQDHGQNWEYFEKINIFSEMFSY